MDDLKNLSAEKVIPVTPEKQEMSWEPTTEPPVTPEKQEEEVLLWQPYQTPKYWAYHENYTSDWFDELQDETMVEYMFRGHAMPDWMIMLKDKINMDFNANKAQTYIHFSSSGIHGAFNSGIRCILFMYSILHSERLGRSRPAAAPRFRLWVY